MTKKVQTPLDKIITVSTKLRLYVEYGNSALDGEDPQDFAKQVLEAYTYLLDFRNIVNGMVSLDEDVSDAAIPYIDHKKIKLAASE